MLISIKYQETNFFSGSDNPITLFFLLINVNIIFMSSYWHFNIYEKKKEKFHAWQI